MIKLVVTDMDNTLYSWVDYIVPAVEAMVESICRSTGYPRVRVVQSLKAVYEKYESNEYPFVLQESSLFADFPEFDSFDKLVIQPARAAFSDARGRYLKPYPRVLETLEKIRDRNIPVVALTDAPRNPAEGRAKKMGFDQLLSKIYTLPGFQFPINPENPDEKLIARNILLREQRGEYRAGCEVVELERECEKPNPAGLLRICREFEVRPEDTLVVGDSIKKDIGAARAVGAIDCWAEYGTYVSAEYRERLDIVSAKAITRRHAAGMMENHGPAEDISTHTLSNFSQVLKIIDAHAAKSGSKRGA